MLLLRDFELDAWVLDGTIIGISGVTWGVRVVEKLPSEAVPLSIVTEIVSYYKLKNIKVRC